MAFQVMRVARSTGLPFHVVDSWPWSDVLRHVIALDEVERVEALQRDMGQVELAIRIGAAMSGENGGQELSRVRSQIRANYRLTIRTPDVIADEERGRQMMAKLDRVQKREARRRRRGTV